MRSSPDRTVAEIAAELGVDAQSLRNWVAQAGIDAGGDLICRVLEIDRSSYYDHLARAEARAAKALAEDELAAEIADL